MPTPGVKARIDRFWRAVKRLQKIMSVNMEQFIENDDLIDAGERNLQVAIEATIDVGEALIACMKWRTPKSYRDVSLILYENKVVNEVLDEQLREAIDIRNILVHNYIYLKPNRIIKNLVGSLTSIMDNIINYMQERGIDP